MTNNVLNFKSGELDRPIYRVITEDRLFELFNDKINVLVRPQKWDDPFENFIMNSTGLLPDGQKFSVKFRDHFYGQCWTRTRESDAIWRIYSPNKCGARITTTPRKLLTALYRSLGDYASISCFIGKVNYYNTKDLKTFLLDNASNLILDSTGVGQAQSLLFKRTPFKHENEVRIIYNSQGTHNDDIFSFSIDPFDLISDIVFDPRMDYNHFSKSKDALRNLGFKKRVVKSLLYDIPELYFNLDR
ncbi:DUF2971 domain-containing protein [Dyadobacter sandarakinus]|uniref:DUF2971 domain-containing protein n=1 Tax=Dyadobacter sandarakinus TaxID=2747268 RepID=A0ABX7I909_9BACT|nr:DUF2971 domain-containing protein [Dyadobacter sandarakinus]QRR02465.1 DUF2971 domain-containing protein [Dyadobacter sandarakinus]